jgi:hypothetical protein
MSRLIQFVIVMALLALVLVVPAHVKACDYGNVGTAFSIVQPQVYAQAFVAQPVYGQAFVQRQVVYPRAIVRQRVVVRERVVAPRARIRVNVGW